MSSSKIALAVKLRWRLRINLCVDKKKVYSVKCRTYQMKAFFEIIFHCMSSVNVSVRVNVLEINKPEKTEDIS